MSENLIVFMDELPEKPKGKIKPYKARTGTTAPRVKMYMTIYWNGKKQASYTVKAKNKDEAKAQMIQDLGISKIGMVWEVVKRRKAQ